MHYHHLTLVTKGRLPYYRDHAELLAILRAIARIARERLLAFGLVDEHLHALVETLDPGRLAQALQLAMRALQPELSWQPAHVVPVKTDRHLRRLIPYFLEQPIKHGLPGHPALWPGSCCTDLLGARLLPGFSLAPLKRAWPRVNQRTVLSTLNMPQVRIRPAQGDLLERAGVSRLGDLAASVYALPSLAGNAPSAAEARRLAVHAARPHFPPAQIAKHLGLSTRTVRRLANQEPPAVALRALRMRLSLLDRLAAPAA